MIGATTRYTEITRTMIGMMMWTCRHTQNIHDYVEFELLEAWTELFEKKWMETGEISDLIWSRNITLCVAHHNESGHGTTVENPGSETEEVDQAINVTGYNHG